MEKVLIGIPNGGKIDTMCAYSLWQLQKFELTTPNERYELIEIEGSQGLYIQENRNNLIRMAQEMQVDWLLQIDSDMSFQSVLLRMLMRTADKTIRPIIAGLYTNIGNVQGGGEFEALNCIYREVEDGQYTVIKPPEDMQPFQVDAVGAGCLLTHVSVFDKLEYPWFYVGVYTNKDGKKQITNEDIGFCRNVRQLGYPVYVDPVADLVHWKTLPLVSSQFQTIYEKALKTKEEMDAK
jgi:hypothetical protein